MKKALLIVCALSLFLTIQIDAQTQTRIQQTEVAYPEVPRISAYEAYTKFKAGKAIIFHGGGMNYNTRHILGAYDLDFRDREGILQKFPKRGIEIFTYCY